jgi:UMF1 family MFS transporter
MYDWANSAFMTTIIAAVFPVYYSQVAAADLEGNVATFRFSIATTIALALVAVVAPVLGALADRAAMKKRLLFAFQSIGVLATAAMFLIQRGEWLSALVLFALGNVGISGAFTFYDSLLPHVARPHELDRVSTAGYALGYLGGGLLLALNLAWITKPAWFGLPDAGVATRLSFLSVAVWWTIFSIPLFRRVPEPVVAAPSDSSTTLGLVRGAFAQLA